MLRNPTYTGIGPRFWSSHGHARRPARRVACLGHAELRQGPAGAGRPHRPPRRRRPGSPASGWGCAADERPRCAGRRRRGRARRGAPPGRPRRRGASSAPTPPALALTRFANSRSTRTSPTSGRPCSLTLSWTAGRTATASTTPSSRRRRPAWPPRSPRPGCGRATPLARPGPARAGWPRPARPTGDRGRHPGRPRRGVARVRRGGRRAETAGYCRRPRSPIRASPTPPGSPCAARPPGGVRRHRPAPRRGRRRPVDVRPAGRPGRRGARARAAAKARAGVDAAPVDPGRYEVVLEPAGGRPTWSQPAGHRAFNGKAGRRGTSFVRLGEQQFDPALRWSTTRCGPARSACRSTPRARRRAAGPGRGRRPGVADHRPADGGAARRRRRPGTPSGRERTSGPVATSPSLGAGTGGSWTTWWPAWSAGCWSATSGTPASSTRSARCGPG